jgi:NTE family protein
MSSILYGNDKFFVPRWRADYALKDPQYFNPSKWTYIYDHSPLVKTLEKYIDYKKRSFRSIETKITRHELKF